MPPGGPRPDTGSLGRPGAPRRFEIQLFAYILIAFAESPLLLFPLPPQWGERGKGEKKKLLAGYKER
jgi:hypothetical protein